MISLSPSVLTNPVRLVQAISLHVGPGFANSSMNMLRINLLSRLRIGLEIYRIRSALHPVPVRLRHLARGLRLLLLLTPPRSSSTARGACGPRPLLAPIGYYIEPEVFYL